MELLCIVHPRGGSPTLGNFQLFGSYKLSFKFRFAVFQQHRNHFGQVIAEFFNGIALRMRPRPSRHITNINIRLSVFFNDCGEGFHMQRLYLGALPE